MEWKYEGFSGAANLAGEGYFRDYLSLKQEDKDKLTALRNMTVDNTYFGRILL